MSFGTTATATIAASEATSTAVELGDNLPAGIKLPSGWTTGNITFEACESAGGTFLPVYDAVTGSPVSIASAAASRWYAISPQDFAGTPYLKLVSSVAQASEVGVLIAMRRND